MQLTSDQIHLVEHPFQSSFFLSGTFGVGKTTVAVHRMLALIRQGVQPSSILVLLPQRTLAIPYLSALESLDSYHGSPLTLLTMGGLARRMVSLYWPLVSDLSGFHSPDLPPSFLTLESAQYFMAHLVEPLFDKGYFSSVALERNRIYSQILDNLNKSAISGFSHGEIGTRLKSAWIGDSTQLNIYDNVQDCVNLFRSFCLENNLLDYSLQIELFRNLIWPSKLCQQNLFSSYKHLIYDNCEEDPPFVHEIVKAWLPHLESAQIIYDEGGGYRHFLGADPDSAQTLSTSCNENFTLSNSFLASPHLFALKEALFNRPELAAKKIVRITKGAIHQSLFVPEESLRFYPQMLDWVVSKIRQLVKSGISPNQIVILAPFMSDMLRFSLSSRLQTAGVLYHSYRPSRALRDEPATQCLLTLTALAYPHWNLPPGHFNLAYAFMIAIADMDLVRAQLLVNHLYHPDNLSQNLDPFDSLSASLRERITYQLGERYDTLRLWLMEAATEPALDVFLSRLFGEILSQPGFRFHLDLDSGHLTANLVESVQKFRLAMGDTDHSLEFTLGKEYLQMVAEGVIAAQYTYTRESKDVEAVTISPAYTFLIQNQPVDYQFWLDISSSAWYERLEQPLTHPYVLSQNWTGEAKWTAEHEIKLSQDTLQRVVSGLLARCRKSVYLGISNLNENGAENRGLLLKLIQNLLVWGQSG
jgi:hypothetical protein